VHLFRIWCAVHLVSQNILTLQIDRNFVSNREESVVKIIDQILLQIGIFCRAEIVEALDFNELLAC
jgi:hypothetical protein